MNKPRVLICDEPTGNLDPITAMEIMELLEQINIRGTTVLMVTHAKDIVDKMNKRVVAIEHGHIVRDEEGSYGYRKQNTEDDQSVYSRDPGYEPFYTSRPKDPDEIIEAERRKTIYLDPEAEAELLSQTRNVSGSDAAVDDMVSAYLNGGEDVYE